MPYEAESFSNPELQRFLERIQQSGFLGELILFVNDGKISNIQKNTKHKPKGAPKIFEIKADRGKYFPLIDNNDRK